MMDEDARINYPLRNIDNFQLKNYQIKVCDIKLSV